MPKNTPIGYQVWNESGEFAKGRSDQEVLDLPTAQQEFRYERRRGNMDFSMNPIYRGDIGDPRFISEEITA